MKLADTALPIGSAPLYSVWIWNGEHTKRRLFKNFADEHLAKVSVKALRGHGLEAELIIRVESA